MNRQQHQHLPPRHEDVWSFVQGELLDPPESRFRHRWCLTEIGVDEETTSNNPRCNGREVDPHYLLKEKKKDKKSKGQELAIYEHEGSLSLSLLSLPPHGTLVPPLPSMARKRGRPPKSPSSSSKTEQHDRSEPLDPLSLDWETLDDIDFASLNPDQTKKNVTCIRSNEE
ncbi:hypothetical protein RIF29_39427 [Crotalaria pallida]|uniref:Uncharacterized protein n=1 Tax=Crotalaria pallida TaxID=3830 RepID=A0AAN9E184_CROPI